MNTGSEFGVALAQVVVGVGGVAARVALAFADLERECAVYKCAKGYMAAAHTVAIQTRIATAPLGFVTVCTTAGAVHSVGVGREQWRCSQCLKDGRWG